MSDFLYVHVIDHTCSLDKQNIFSFETNGYLRCTNPCTSVRAPFVHLCRHRSFRGIKKCEDNRVLTITTATAKLSEKGELLQSKLGEVMRPSVHFHQWLQCHLLWNSYPLHVSFAWSWNMMASLVIKHT